MIKYINTIIILSLLFSSCKLFKDDDTVTTSTKITVNQNLLSSGQSKKTYLLLTNPTSNTLPNPGVKINGSSTRSSNNRNSATTEAINSVKRIDAPVRGLPNSYKVSGGYRAISTALEYKENETETFNVIGENGYKDVDFTLMSLKEDIGETDIDLYIWVDTSEKEYASESIEHLAKKFIDIYPDMVNSYGIHWGEHGYSNILSADRDDFHILLMDIEYDENKGKDGAIYGYFDSRDLFLNDYSSDDEVVNSNQSLNIVLDSHVYFNRALTQDGKSRDWSEYNLDTIDGISTMIHEFQHMIHNYQKRIRNVPQISNDSEDIFVDEMFAMMAEDLMAEKYLRTEKGFVPPDFARIPMFNQGWMDQGSFEWNNNSLQSYSNAYTMGAYLIRNYDYDYSFIKKYFTNEVLGIDGLISALQLVSNDSSFSRKDLLHNFGSAVLNSNKTDTSFPIRFYDDELITFGGNKLAGLNLFSSNYYSPVFTPYQLSEYSDISSSTNLGFGMESNIYIDLGELSSSDIIEIDFYNTDRDIEYSFVY